MPNVLNERMLTEIQGFLAESQDCVVLDFQGLTVDATESLRRKLRENQMRIRVLKSSLARLAARGAGFQGTDDLFAGPSAIVYGGDSVATVARVISELTKGKDVPKVRGGLLEKKAIGPEQVSQLAKLPTRKELLGQVLATIIAPLSGVAGAMNQLLGAVPSLTQALHDKNEGAAEGGG